MTTQRHFHFAIDGPDDLHRWLGEVSSCVTAELAESLDELQAMSSPDGEHILVYLHHMYFLRFVLPTLEAVLGREATAKSPEIVRFQLLACLMGRFADDLIDQDSGFWDGPHSRQLYSHYLVRCERARGHLDLGHEAEQRWRNAMRFTLLDDRRLYDTAPGRLALRPPIACAWTYADYWRRVTYFFWALQELATDDARLQWTKDYVSALFYHYDVDDALNDILRNVPTEPSHALVRCLTDDEGRLKLVGGGFAKELAVLQARAREQLAACREHGKQLGLWLGPAMLARELAAAD